jgi:sterol desaturase/sphingolipid hydroxylase (fatty acid hydroxylase superfamily)
MQDETLLLAIKAGAVCIWLMLLFLLERLRPAAPESLRLPRPPDEGRFGWRRLSRNLALWLGNSVLSVLVILPVTAFAASISPVTRPEWLTGWLGLFADLLVLDLAIYWWHRANHLVPFLWRFHEVHHLDERLDTTSALRFHFGEVLLSAIVRALVILALGIPLSSILVFEALVLVSTLFHHANISLPPAFERALARVIVTPSIHWVHHHAIRRDTDSNYATILSVWDRLFGTRSLSRRDIDMRIGVEGLADRPLAELIVRPFRSKQSDRAG